MKYFSCLTIVLATAWSCTTKHHQQIDEAKELAPVTEIQESPEVSLHISPEFADSNRNAFLKFLNNQQPACERLGAGYVLSNEASFPSAFQLTVSKGALLASIDTAAHAGILRGNSLREIEEHLQSKPGFFQDLHDCLNTHLQAQHTFGADKAITDTLLRNMGILLSPTEDFYILQSDLDFVWLKKDLKFTDSILVDDPEENRSYYQKIDKNIALHLFATNIEQSEFATINNPTKVRDSVLQEHWQHELENSRKMETHKLLKDRCIPLSSDSLPYHRYWGSWQIKKSFQQGVFVTHIIYAPHRKRGVYLEGFVNAPGVARKKYLRELELILQTAKIL